MLARWPGEFIQERNTSWPLGWPMAIFSATGWLVCTIRWFTVIHVACCRADFIKSGSTSNGGNWYFARSKFVSWTICSSMGIRSDFFSTAGGIGWLETWAGWPGAGAG
jgi:hypothetical protein